MKINNYKILISNLPVKQQSFKTKRTTWNKAESQIEWLKKLNEGIFHNKPTLTISRQDIFETKDLIEKIVKTIYWGYPYGMRGNHFVDILKHIDLIESAFKKLKQTDRPTTEDFNNLTITLKSVKGLGLSTYSKLLYFFKLTFNDNPCLILDQRLIDVFANKTYFEFQQLSKVCYENAEKNYLNFLQITQQLAEKIETEGENIEVFLFTFGNNLKTTNVNESKISNMWNGYCPESLLDGKTVRMRLNQNDFFESEETGLQICIITGVQAVILNFRGQGKFRTNIKYADEIENGEILSPQNSDRPPFNNPTTAFGESEEIEKYITTIN
ncbi:hypothetical protein [Pedobacter sp. UYP30]|uniref:8-oxoguanine DNA glycosylase OGG fold protein n=1 Tax=Pedobacter sp. UYP30 TaxID=1756400 RepID=UPI003393C173